MSMRLYSLPFLLLIFISLVLLFSFVSVSFGQEAPPQFLFKWGSLGSGDGQFDFPQGIAMDSSNNIYVVDTGNYRIQKFNNTGAFITKWGSFGAGDGQLSTSHFITVDHVNNIYVADAGNSRIQKFTNNGVFLTKWGSLGSGDGQFSNVRGISSDSIDNIYVVDAGNNRIQKFTNSGVFITKWGSFGVGDGQFDFPLDITIDSLDNVYVVDNNNNRIQKFSKNGDFLAKWGFFGAGDGQFNEPVGITTDSSGNVYVSEFKNYRIQKFDNNSNFLTKWGSFGSGDGQFSVPTGIAIDSLNNIYITDSVNSRIQVFGVLQLPTFSNLGQFKSDGSMPILESRTTTESSEDDPRKSVIVFKAILSDPNNDQVKLEVELKKFDQVFDGAGVIESSFVSSDSEAVITKEGLEEGEYHWRARTIDIQGNASDWKEFETPGNIDFKVKLVPLYTQIESQFPIRVPQDEWANEVYAEGRGNLGGGKQRCGLFIKQCGCAITSSVMILRYHDVTEGIDSFDVNPKNINTWLNANNGYDSLGNLKWRKVSEYSKLNPLALARVKFDGLIDSKDNATLDQYLTNSDPVILHNRSAGHFLVADGKLSATYTVKDPRWYKTQYLAQSVTDPNFEKDYINNFDGLRLYRKLLSGIDGIQFNLGSPAELLVTDPQGRRLGKDPITSIVYNEIPGGSYGKEGLSDDTAEIPVPPKESKIIDIPQPVSGQYNIQVIGIDLGSYTLDSLVYDTNSQSHSQTFSGNTQSALVSEYDLNFTPLQPENISIQLVSEKIDECPTLPGSDSNLGCPAKIDFLSLEKISNSAGVLELLGPQGETRYTAPVVEGQRGTTEVGAKLYNEAILLNLLGNPRKVPLDQLCVIFDDPSKDSALVSHLIKRTDSGGRYSFGVPSSIISYALIESVKEIIAGQFKRICVLEEILPRHFDNATNIAFREVNKIVAVTRETHTGAIIVKKRAGHTSQILSAGESLWSLVNSFLGTSQKEIAEAVKTIAKHNGIRIPEWGLSEGVFDARKLKAGFNIDLSLIEDLFK